MKKTLEKNFAFVKKIIILLFLFLLAFWICMQSSFAPSGSYAANSDSAIYKQIAFSITKGDVPYRDIYDNKGPVFYYLLAIGENFNSTYGIFLIELLLMFIAMIFCYKTAKMFTSAIVAMLATILTFSRIK